jgi:hypothetical protein
MKRKEGKSKKKNNTKKEKFKIDFTIESTFPERIIESDLFKNITLLKIIFYRTKAFLLSWS